MWETRSVRLERTGTYEREVRVGGTTQRSKDEWEPRVNEVLWESHSGDGPIYDWNL